MFNSIALISNSQLYIENYVNNRGLKLVKDIVDENDEVIYSEKLIEKYVLHQQPKKIYYYQNKEDICPSPHNSYGDCIQFKKFLENNNLENICEFVIFTPNNEVSKNVHPHSIQFPYNKKHIKMLDNIINY